MNNAAMTFDAAPLSAAASHCWSCVGASLFHQNIQDHVQLPLGLGLLPEEVLLGEVVLGDLLDVTPDLVIGPLMDAPGRVILFDLLDVPDQFLLGARLTGKGIRLLAGGIDDKMIEV